MQQSLFNQPTLFTSGGNREANPSASASVQNDKSLIQPLESVVLTVIDLETTGLNPKKNAITEVVAKKYQNGQLLETFASLVSPTEPIPPEVTAITGITPEMVQNAPPLMQVLGDLAEFLGADPILVGHNVAFDVAFLQEKYTNTVLFSAKPLLRLETSLCTKVLAQKALPGLPSYEGVVVATQCGVKNDNPHRAEYDVLMCAGILFALIERIRQQGVPVATVQALLDYQGPLKSR
ncbi:MAG: 3'-5' exonuclease [Candidatus Melainabacteria bacterium]|nr:3'-5' exonuclease [Candidatus Melainabacteria bacterium]